MSPSSPFLHPPPSLSPHTLLTFPTANHTILLVTLNRPVSHNCIAASQHHELAAVWDWMDTEPRLRCGIITGAGGKAFCAGADLKEWHASHSRSSSSSSSSLLPPLPPTGFAGLSNRHLPTAKNPLHKPIISAIRGLCLGGGFEAALNTDLILASPSAIFSLPESSVGVVALAGALPRLARCVGRQRAMEMCLVGGRKGAEEMRTWGVVNEVVGDGYGGGEGERGGGDGYTGVVRRAIEVAETIAGNSPDSVVVSKYGMELGWAGIGVAEATAEVMRVMREKGVEGGENMREGVKAFVERRPPKWADSKL